METRLQVITIVNDQMPRTQPQEGTVMTAEFMPFSKVVKFTIRYVYVRLEVGIKSTVRAPKCETSTEEVRRVTPNPAVDARRMML